MIECDAYATRQMRFRDFMEKYEEDQLSVHDHPIRRGDMPLFIEHVSIRFRLAQYP